MKKYSKIITTILEQEAAHTPDNMPQIRHQLIVDEKRQQYILLAMGWNGNEYIHDWLFHLELKDGKIWIHEDLTDPGVKVKLLAKEVPDEDIVLAYLQEFEYKVVAEIMEF